MAVGIIIGDKMVVFRLLFLILCSANGILALIFSFGTQTPAVPAPNTFNQNCRDKLNNCHAFEQSSCRPPYEQWARENCPNHCGFCMGPTTPAPPCVDKIPGCESYEKAVCSNPDFRTWVNENCRLFCRRCPPEVLAVIDALTTVIPPDQCYDRVDCRVYGTNACTGNYRQWAQVNCPNHCGFCVGLPTPPPICRDRIPNCNTYNPDACTNPDFKLWAEDNCKKFCHICVSGSTIAFVPPSPPAPGKKRAVTLKPFECKNKLPNCHEFEDGTLCTDPSYYRWARENCYKYCRFPPCGTHGKRQFVASHHHHGDYEKCWDFKGELNSTSDICTTMVPTQNPATITTAGPGQTTEEFNASQFKPNHKPPPDWDKKASTAAPETTTPKTATVDHTTDAASGQTTNGPDGTTPTGVSEPTGSTPSIATGSPVSGTASTNSPITPVTNSPATASTDSPVTSQTNSPMTASTNSPATGVTNKPLRASTNAPMTASTDSPMSTGSPISPNSAGATSTSAATPSTSHGHVSAEASTKTTASTEAPITATPSVSSTTKATNTIKTPPPLHTNSSTAGTPPPFNTSSSTQRTPTLNTGSSTHGIPPTPTTVTTGKPCVDSRDCTKFNPAELCTLPVYRSFAEGNCPAFCKFCIPVNSKPFECKDKLANCHEYEDGTICTSTGYYSWAKENCYKYCRFPPCGNNTVHEITTPAATTKPPTTTEDPSGCRDLSDTCIYYADEKCCGIYAPWAKSHCAKRCGYCGTLACVDEESHCAKFPAEICTADSYRGWARKNCRKFCNLCASSMPCANETTTPQTTYPWFNHVSDTGTTAELITPGEPVTSVKPTIKVTTPATDNIPMG